MSLDLDLVLDQRDHPDRATVNAIVDVARAHDLDRALLARLDEWLATQTDVPTAQWVVYEGNLTGNLAVMAAEAGLRRALWGAHGRRAGDLVPELEAGLDRLQADPGRFRPYEARNGHGRVADLVRFAKAVLDAARAHPDAVAHTSA